MFLVALIPFFSILKMLSEARQKKQNANASIPFIMKYIYTTTNHIVDEVCGC